MRQIQASLAHGESRGLRHRSGRPEALEDRISEVSVHLIRLDAHKLKKFLRVRHRQRLQQNRVNHVEDHHVRTDAER